MKLLTKTGLGLASLILSANVQAKEPVVPSVKPDDGRASLAKTYDKDISWYLSVPLVPYISLTDCTMVTDIINIAKNFPEIDFDNLTDKNGMIDKQNVEDLITELRSLPNVHGNFSVNPSLRFGFLSKWFEMHAYGAIESNSGVKYNSIKGEYEIDENEQEVRFEDGQQIVQAAAYADIVAGAKFVVPVRVADIIIKPYIGAGYRHREIARFSFYTKETVKSEDDLYMTDSDDIRTNAEGFFLGTGIKADFSRLEKYLQPVLAFEVENFYSQFYYQNNPLELATHDPVRFNLGLQINPFDLLKLRADFLDISNKPEFRVEVNKQFGVIDLALYGQLNQRDVLDDIRHSFNFYFGIVHDIVNFGLYGSVDNRSNFGAGIMLSLGWHPDYK